MWMDQLVQRGAARFERGANLMGLTSHARVPGPAAGWKPGAMLTHQKEGQQLARAQQQ